MSRIEVAVVVNIPPKFSDPRLTLHGPSASEEEPSDNFHFKYEIHCNKGPIGLSLDKVGDNIIIAKQPAPKSPTGKQGAKRRTLSCHKWGTNWVE